MLRWGSRHSTDEKYGDASRRSTIEEGRELEETSEDSPLHDLRRQLAPPPWLCGASGVPSCVDGFAYEPIQKLLSLSTTDGRVKVLGKIGVEVTLFSSAARPFGTRALEFVVNRGTLVRVSEAGFLEAWSIGGATSEEEGDSCVHPLAQIKPEGDEICCVAAMPRDPYLLLGCKSGMLRVAAFVTSVGTLSCDLHTASRLQLIPYWVTAENMQGAGALVTLAVHSFAGIHMVLAMHENTGLCLWDLRSQRLRASFRQDAKNPLSEALKGAGRVTTCCWLSSAAGGTGSTGISGGGRDFATGHEKGDILIWSLPKLEEYVTADKTGAKNQPLPHVVAVLRVSGRDDWAEPVRSLTCVGQPEGRDALLVLGGQSEGQPDGLTLLKLSGMAKQGVAAEHGATSEPESDDEVFNPETIKRVKMPWFGTPLGFSTVPKPGNITGTEEPATVIQLLDGGRLVVHDIAGGKPTVFTMPFQSLQGVSTTGACLVPCTHPPFRHITPLTLAAMREVAHRSGAMETALDLGVIAWSTGDERSEASQALHGGQPPQPLTHLSMSTVYCTGHKDGHVRTWDVFGEQPQLLFSTPSLPICLPPPDTHTHSHAKRGPCALPSTPAASATAVTALDLAWQHGLLLTGHVNGEVRMYNFATSPQQVSVALLDSVAPPALSQDLRPYEPNEPLLPHPYPPTHELPEPSLSAHEQPTFGGRPHSHYERSSSRMSGSHYHFEHQHSGLSLDGAHGVAASPSRSRACAAAQQTAAVVGEGVQGPGWQLRLLCCLHQAEISCLAYCAANRVVVVGDKTGVVSVIDVPRALVLWSLPHMQLPVISARLAHVRLPSLRERSMGLVATEAGLPEGVAVPGVAITCADGSSLVVSLGSGHPIGKHGELRPKSTSQVLLMELLDGDFSPVWMRDVLVANETIALAEEAAEAKRAKQAAKRSKNHGKKAQQAHSNSGSKQKGGESSEGEGQSNRGGAAESSGYSSGADSDVDDWLAAAIEKMQGAKKKDRVQKVLTLGVGKDRRKKEDLSLQDLAKKTTQKADGEGDSEDEQEKEMEEAVQHTEQPVAEHMLLVTDSYIRIYSVRHVVLGSSCTSASLELTTPLIYASLFQMDEAPALLTVSLQDGSEEAAFQVYAVPSLALLAHLPAHEALRGCTWKPPQDSVLKIQRILSASRLGRTLLIGEDNELLQLSPMPSEIDPIVPPVQLHDWDLAAAAHEASVAFERAELMVRCSRGSRKRRMQRELRKQQEAAHAEQVRYMAEQQQVQQQREQQRAHGKASPPPHQHHQQQQQKGQPRSGRPSSSSGRGWEGVHEHEHAREHGSSQQVHLHYHEKEPEGLERSTSEEACVQGQGENSDEEGEEGADAEQLPTSSPAGEPEAEAAEAAAKEQERQERKKRKEHNRAKKRKNQGFSGVLNTVGKGMSKGFTSVTRTVSALPTSVANVFQDSKDATPQPSFIEVDPEPFELYDRQYPDLKSIMSQPMPKDPRRGKGNREDDGIKPVRPKPLKASVPGTSVLDSQLPSGAATPRDAPSASMRMGSGTIDIENDSRSSLDSRASFHRHVPGSGVSASVALQPGTGRAIASSDGRKSAGTVFVESGSGRSRKVLREDAGLRASAPVLPTVSSVGALEEAEGRQTQRAGSSSLSHCKSDSDHGPHSMGQQPQHISRSEPPAEEEKLSGLKSLLGIGGSKRSSAVGGKQGGDANNEEGKEEKPLTKRLTAMLGLNSSQHEHTSTPASPSTPHEGRHRPDTHEIASGRPTPRSSAAGGPAAGSRSDERHRAPRASVSPPRVPSKASPDPEPPRVPDRQPLSRRVSDHGRGAHEPRAAAGVAAARSEPGGRREPRRSEAYEEEEEEQEMEMGRGSAGGGQGGLSSLVAEGTDGVRRTASDIKRKYGRRVSNDDVATSANRKGQSVGAEAAQTRSKLAERGEKLGAINQLTMEMQDGAAGFAEMAKRIAENEKRRWW